MDPKELQEKIERKYLLILLELINTNSITDEIVHESTKLIASMRPYDSFEDAKSKIDFMSTKFSFLSSIEDYVSGLETGANSREVVDKMHIHLKDNDVDFALDIAKKFIKK